MKNILLVGGISTSDEDVQVMYEFEAYLSRVLGNQANCRKAYTDDLYYLIAPGSFQVYDTRNHLEVSDVNVVYIRGMRVPLPNTQAYYLSRYCAWVDLPCIADYSPYCPPGKIPQAITFVEEGVPFLQTVYTVNNEKLLDLASKHLGYPYVLKTTVGSHGDSNYLITDRADAEAIIHHEPGIDFLAQQYCPNDYDYRLLLAGNEHLLFERYGPVGSYLNNTSKGGRANVSVRQLPAEVIDQARAVARRLGLSIAGVDIIPDRDTGQLYFLEVNLQPQLRTGVLLHEKEELLKRFFASLS